MAETDENASKTKQTNFRLRPEDVAEFREFCKDNHVQNDEGFHYLLKIMKLNAMGEKSARVKVDAAELQQYLSWITDTFNKMAEQIISSEEFAYNEFENELDMKSVEISNLKSDNDSLKKELDKAKEAASVAESKYDKATDTANDKTALNESLQAQINLQNEMIADLKAQIAELKAKPEEAKKPKQTPSRSRSKKADTKPQEDDPMKPQKGQTMLGDDGEILEYKSEEQPTE